MTTVLPAGTPLRLPNGLQGAPNPYRSEPLTTPDEWIHPPWPYAVVPAPEALDAVSALRRVYGESSAVILGNVWTTAFALRDMESAAERRSLAEILAAAEKLDLDQWLAAGIAELEPEEDDFWTYFDPDAPPSAIPPRDDTCYAAGSSPVDVVVGLIPTADPTEVPAHLGFGDFNGCEPPEYHVAMARRWRDRHGAELVACAHDTIEFRVARPVTDERTCATVADDADVYNSDVNQVYGGRPELARHLRGAEVWHLWWD